MSCPANMLDDGSPFPGAIARDAVLMAAVPDAVPGPPAADYAPTKKTERRMGCATASICAGHGMPCPYKCRTSSRCFVIAETKFEGTPLLPRE